MFLKPTKIEPSTHDIGSPRVLIVSNSVVEQLPVCHEAETADD